MSRGVGSCQQQQQNSEAFSLASTWFNAPLGAKRFPKFLWWPLRCFSSRGILSCFVLCRKRMISWSSCSTLLASFTSCCVFFGTEEEPRALAWNHNFPMKYRNTRANVTNLRDAPCCTRHMAHDLLCCFVAEFIEPCWLWNTIKKSPNLSHSLSLLASFFDGSCLPSRVCYFSSGSRFSWIHQEAVGPVPGRLSQLTSEKRFGGVTWMVKLLV